MNENLDWMSKITFNILSSTPPQDVFDTITQGSQNSKLRLQPDYLHNVSERPRQLMGYDVCLKPQDADWHVPLICAYCTSARSTRNKRTRGQAAQDLRYTSGTVNTRTDHFSVNNKLLAFQRFRSDPQVESCLQYANGTGALVVTEPHGVDR